MKFYKGFMHSICKKHKLLFKSFLIMKLTAILLFLFCFKVSATLHAQSISLNVKEESLHKIFSEIKKQSDYTFWYDDVLMKTSRSVSIRIKNANINTVLDQVLKNQSLTYHIVEKTVVIKKKIHGVLDPITSYLKSLTVAGKVIDENNAPLVGAVVKVKGSTKSVLTDKKGEFILTGLEDSAILIISFLGFETQEIAAVKDLSNIKMIMSNAVLTEVEIVSTGYQNIPKERATGSFSQPDKKMYEGRVSTDVISRLEGITSGLVFNSVGTTGGNTDPLTIRGRSTIYSNSQPLIIIDNFPYDGDVNNINPNDVESITILKDAAAASIWGARSGNGVIVITTKRGKLNQDLKISLNTNITVSNKPDLFYDPNTLKSSDLIDLEKELFIKGFYAGKLADPGKPIISPVVALLEKARLGSINKDVASSKIEQMRNQEVRDDLKKYFYRNAINQQYAINITGGNDKNAYYLSAGYDNNRSVQKANDFNRITINLNNNFRVINNLNINLGVNYVQNTAETNNALSFIKTGLNAFPYTLLADENDNPLSIGLNYSPLFTETIQNKGFLNWDFNPINELDGAYNTNENKTNDIRLSSGIDYSIISGLKASLVYQYQRSNSLNKNLSRQDSYYTRDLINSYSIVNANGQVVDYNIPLGAILTRINNIKTSTNTRGQLEYNKKSRKHEVNVIMGLETREVNGESQNSMLYGYDEETGVNGNVNTKSSFQRNPSGFGQIGNGLGTGGTIDRFTSYFGNGAYTYNNKYALSVSVRKDKSNLFGVNANLKGVPLWSVGAKWDLSKEQFYHINWLPVFNLRATYGFNGNINTSLTAITTFQIFSNDVTGLTNLPTARVTNYGNLDLKWEKIGIFNIGIDFGSKDRIIYGSLEYFRKNGKDLIGERLFPPTSGVTSFSGNYAATKGEGWDLKINTKNLSNGSFNWESLFLFSNATDKVTEYSIPTLPQQLLGNGKSLSVYVGKPMYSIFSTKWAGLNPVTGAPRGFGADGNISEVYTDLINPKTFDELVYNGPARPTIFGGLRNTVNYKSLSFSFNISYKLGYYFRKNSINYNRLYSSYVGHQDYSLRWKNPGDEVRSNIPSSIYPGNPNRDSFFSLSDILVEKSDHIRLQDINLTYSFNSKFLNSINFNSIQVYGYMNNIGILWKATNTDLDPDFPNGGILNPKTISFGIKALF